MRLSPESRFLSCTHRPRYSWRALSQFHPPTPIPAQFPGPLLAQMRYFSVPRSTLCLLSNHLVSPSTSGSVPPGSYQSLDRLWLFPVFFFLSVLGPSGLGPSESILTFSLLRPPRNAVRFFTHPFLPPDFFPKLSDSHLRSAVSQASSPPTWCCQNFRPAF